MDSNNLTELNFLDWLKNLRIILKRERLAYVIVEPLPQSPTIDAPESVQGAYQKLLVDSARVGLIIHTSMTPEFQKQYKTMDTYSIVLYGNIIMSRQVLKGSKSLSSFLVLRWRRGHPQCNMH